MRVVCSDLDAFLLNLQHEPPSNIFQHAVHVSTTSRPLDSSDKRKAVKFAITFQASAIINLDDGGQYMIDYGEDCGVDYRDDSQELVGSDYAAKLRAKLVEFCDDRGLSIRPGIVEL